MTVLHLYPICRDEATLRSILVSLITAALMKRGFSSVGLRCSILIWPVMHSTPLITEDEPLAIWMLSSHCPGTYDSPNGAERPRITGRVSSSIWVYTPDRPSRRIWRAPVTASEYPTVTLAEFSKLSARLQHAILHSPAAEMTSVRISLPLERKFPAWRDTNTAASRLSARSP